VTDASFDEEAYWFGPQGITAITSGIHTAHPPFLGVQVAPKLKHLDPN
jgi:hypothetical protein